MLFAPVDKPTAPLYRLSEGVNRISESNCSRAELGETVDGPGRQGCIMLLTECHCVGLSRWPRCRLLPRDPGKQIEFLRVNLIRC